jgi:hypothetical protein
MLLNVLIEIIKYFFRLSFACLSSVDTSLIHCRNKFIKLFFFFNLAIKLSIFFHGWYLKHIYILSKLLHESSNHINFLNLTINFYICS